MTTKKDMTPDKKVPAKSSDTLIYRVMIALAVICLAILGLHSLRGYYATMDGFDRLYDLTPAIALIGLAVAIAAAVLCVVLRKPMVRFLFGWLLFLGVITAFTGWNMRISGVADFNFLYYLCGAVAVQYIVYLIYGGEFFLFSLSTASAGAFFMTFSRRTGWNSKAILLTVILALVLLGTAAATRKASANKGVLKLGKLSFHLFTRKSTPVLIYIVDLLWLLCAVAGLLLGSLFCYYCVFAALAVEFVAAVYYTFQLN